MSISLRGSVCSAPPPAAFSGKAAVLFEDVGVDLEIFLEKAALGKALDSSLITQLLVLLGIYR